MSRPSCAQAARRVLVIEDEPDMARLLCLHLAEMPAVVQAISDGISGLQAAQQRGPWDLIVLDLRLPGLGGLDVCRALRQAGDPVPILMLTARGAELDRVLGLELGADDYLTKPFAMEELLARVEVLGRRNGSAPEAPEPVLRVGAISMDVAKRRVTRGDERVELSPREFEVLTVFMREPGRTFSRDEICERIWEREHEYDTRTVEIFVMRLRKKLDRPGTESVIGTVRGVGYVMQTSK